MSYPFVIPPLLAPDQEDLPIFFLTPLLSPAPVGTEFPPSQAGAEANYLPNGFVRIEGADCTRHSLSEWNIGFVSRTFSPDEGQASDIDNQLRAYCSAAQGLTVIVPSGVASGSWYIAAVVSVVGGKRLTDPDISLPEYRSGVVWRVQGRPIT